MLVDARDGIHRRRYPRAPSTCSHGHLSQTMKPSSTSCWITGWSRRRAAALAAPAISACRSASHLGGGRCAANLQGSGTQALRHRSGKGRSGGQERCLESTGIGFLCMGNRPIYSDERRAAMASIRAWASAFHSATRPEMRPADSSRHWGRHNPARSLAKPAVWPLAGPPGRPVPWP